MNQTQCYDGAMGYYIIIRGPLGSGKTTIAKALAARLNADYLSVDEIIDAHHLAADQEDGFISQNSFKQANTHLAEIAKPLLDQKKPVIIDGNFYWKSQIEDLAAKLIYPHAIFTLYAPLQLCIERDGKRGHPIGKDAAEAVYNKTTSIEAGRKINADRNLEEIITEIIDILLLKK